MKVFLTGATGYVGAAVAAKLKAAGHEVAGLTHDPAKKAALEAAGLRAVVGDLKDPAGWRKEADSCEALVHAGFEMGDKTAQADKAAIEALAASAAGAGAPRLIVYTSGVWVLGGTSQPANEHSPLNPAAVSAWRPPHEKLALAAAGGKISAAVIRPGCVYGGRAGLYGDMIAEASGKGILRYVGDGANCWAAVYLDDLAELYRLVIEKRPDRATYHAADGAAEPMKEVASALAQAAGAKGAVSWPLPEARQALGPRAEALALDQRISSEKARKELGWAPKLDSVAKNAPRLVAEWKGRMS